MRILITAGPTWVKVDAIRIISSIFTGRTGLFLAEEFKKIGHKVTLIINSHGIKKIDRIHIIPFRYFDEFKEKIIKELKRKYYDLIIHSAAVSDYKIKKPIKGKITSNKKILILKLIPTEKIITTIRKLAKKSILVQFKLEVNREELIEKAYKSLKENKSDFVVANALEDLKRGYKSFIIDKKKHIISINSRKSLFNNLNKILLNKI